MLYFKGEEKMPLEPIGTRTPGKPGTERAEKNFPSITTDKGQLNAPGRCPNNEQGIP